jgi:hypothetical protein
MPSSDDEKDVLVIIGLHEDGDEDCNNQLIEEETGLAAATVDAVLDHLWRTDRIEAIQAGGDRNPSLDKIRRVLAERERLWGDDGRFEANQSV